MLASTAWRSPVPFPRVLMLLMLGTLLGGCAAPKHRPYDPAARTKIHRIGLLTPAVSDEVAVRMKVHPGRSFGVVGMLLAEGDMDDKTGTFTRATQERGFICSQSFRRQLDAGLRMAGYEVRAMNVPRPQGQSEFLDQYPVDDGSVDAYLDVYTDLVGYTATSGGTPYRPTVYLNVRLVRAVDHRVLYQDRISYNAFGDGGGAITLTADQDYEFRDFDQLVAEPARAVEGLQMAMQATGDELVRQLR